MRHARPVQDRTDQDPRPGQLVMDVDAGGFGTVTLDGRPLATSEVHISTVVGHPTRVQLTMPAVMVSATLNSPEGRYRVAAPVGLEDGKPVVREAMAWTLGAALRALGDMADEYSAQAGVSDEA